MPAQETTQPQVEQMALPTTQPRSEEHTSELQSPCNLVCRLLLEKKKVVFPPLDQSFRIRERLEHLRRNCVDRDPASLRTTACGGAGLAIEDASDKTVSGVATVFV